MTIITLGFISFMNLFLIPIIGLKIYCKRHEIEWNITMETGYLYVLFLVLNFLLTHVLVKIVEILVHTVIHLEMSKYTMLALGSSIVLAFLMEGIEKYVHVKVSVSVRESQRKKKRIKKNSQYSGGSR